jgi:hypothetical protein
VKHLIAFLCSALFAIPALAHKGSDAYLDVKQTADQVTLQLSVAIKDLDVVLPVDANADGLVTFGEVQDATPAVEALIQSNALIQGASGSCPLQWRYAGLERYSDGAYIKLESTANCAALESIRYTLFKNEDENHRLLVSGNVNGRDLLTTASPQQSEPIMLVTRNAASQAAPTGVGQTVLSYFALGMHHLLEGYDHLAFLLALVLPLQLVLGRKSGPGPLTDTRPWWALLCTVTAFTVGHSITLALASLGITSASPEWVEPVIAASIGVTALLNVFPVKVFSPWRLALGLGLIHGYGFAGLLTEAAAPSALLGWALLGFNLGVEAGQLLAVLLWVAVSQLFVRQAWYGSVVVRGGSIALFALAAYWVWERVFA